MEPTEDFLKILKAKKGYCDDSRHLNESETIPSPLMMGTLTQDRVVAALDYARSMKYVDELLIVFGLLRKERRISAEQEESLARALGWRKGVVESILSNPDAVERICRGIGVDKILDALAARIQDGFNNNHVSEGENQSA
jgi:hypothetical protein